MNILLINSNPVVSRLITLCMHEKNTVFEEVESIKDIILDRYAVVFVDDESCSDETKRVLSNLMIRKKVLLSTRDEETEVLDIFDILIKKPFLPSQIYALFEDMDERENIQKEMKLPSIFPLSSESKIVEKINHKEPPLEVLDRSEIEKIKAILDMDEEVLVEEVFNEKEIEARKVAVIKEQLEADGLEIISEKEYVETLSSKSSKRKEKKKKKSKKIKEEYFPFEEALMEAVKGMKIKKIKKLLKGAEVTIKINFKDKK